jgi:hypothetical protein
VSLGRVFSRLHYRGYCQSNYQRQDKKEGYEKSFGGKLMESNEMMELNPINFDSFAVLNVIQF